MPTINLKPKKKNPVNTTAKNKAQSIYSDKRWKALRESIIYEEPICRRCAEDLNRTRLAQEVHHIVPFGTGSTVKQIESLAFDRDNCEPLCIECHKFKHKEIKR